ncbi:MAG TPA: heme o synthase [Vicinamibacterales bacterium]|nr:heme o synthase [Vicinamibacterales bacterium]
MRSLGRVTPYVELTKPRITMMVLFSTGAGYLAATQDRWQPIALLQTLIATGLLASGTSALNQWYERDTDAAMRRTCRRPIPSGRVSARRALAFGVALLAAGTGALLAAATAHAAAAGLLTAASYLLVYTPLKRRSSLCVFAGAFAGAMPPVIGSVAALERVDPIGLSLFALLFVWQVPHVYAIAMMYRDDYDRGGLHMLPPSADRHGNPGSHIVAWSMLLAVVSLGPVAIGTAGPGYAACAVALNLAFAYQAVRVWIEPTVQQARRVLLASVTYLPALLGVAVLDSALPRVLAVLSH